MTRIIAPSILSADFSRLGEEVESLDRTSAEWIHFDVMDGVFVPNISFGFPVLDAVRKVSSKLLDVHLMITEPERYVERFAQAGAAYITFHIEATSDPKACIELIRRSGAKVGISVKPATPVSAVAPYLKMVDMVLVMSVEPGYGGQKFIESSVDKVRELKEMIQTANPSCLIEMDGGISSLNSIRLFEAGADVLVAGSAVFKAEDRIGEISKMLGE